MLQLQYKYNLLFFKVIIQCEKKRNEKRENKMER